MGRRFSKSLGRKTHGNPQASISTLNEDEALEFIESFDGDPFVLLLDQVQDPRNLGACLRSADGAGVDLVVIPTDRSAGLTEVVRHVAAGAAESLSLARAKNLSRFMARLKELGVKLVGTSDQAKHSIFESDLQGPIGLVVGAEGTGIRRLTADNCDLLANIPMTGGVDCLNVSVATGVCLFEIRRQRSFSSSGS
ncbi:23S rRNA (guanosine(2251)-2'-O)-methyltransferase RlmB [Verrucomicrobia bacterium]|jgi:23S rRNA (guanosine2251-2'-O)-methyltransferase|nr:23S rRNA (guanosine(2251)-2'-O)-methyltransferase RlmB [Verrucomicrobiota bacterium]